MAILNSLPKGIDLATETNNGLMSFEDKILVNKIPRLETNVELKMNKNEKIKSSQLDISSNDTRIKPENLSDEVKQMMTGKSPVTPVLSDDIIKTSYLADNSVTSYKRTAVGSVAAIASEKFFNFNTIGDSVVFEIPDTYTVFYGPYRDDVVDGKVRQEKDIYLTKDEPSIIAYNLVYGFVAYPGQAMHEDDYLIGVFDGQNVAMFNGRYTVNGSVVIGDGSLDGSAIKDFSLDSKKLAIQHTQIISDRTGGPYLNANFGSRFIEVVKEFVVNIADQYTMTIKASQNCEIPENINNNKYLYIYYDIGDNDILKALWSTLDIETSVLQNNEKLILIGIIYNSQYAIGTNSEFISVNAVSKNIKSIEYIDILTGNITIDLDNKEITAKDLTAFIDNSVVSLLETDFQTIDLTDDIVTDIINSKPYTIGATRIDFDTDEYRLVFKKTEDIDSFGLDTIYIASIEKYKISNNRNVITLIKPNGDAVKSDNIVSFGYMLPIDNTTIVVELSTEVIDGNLMLTSKTVSGTSIVDSTTNMQYDIKQETKSQSRIDDLHGLYSVLFNTETGAVDIIKTSIIIDKTKYVSLGFVYELSDSLSYEALGPITEHITLNANRPSNYSIIDGPDPDKGYDWSNNRLVLPKDIYLLNNSQYSIYCQNMSMNKYIDNDYILYEIGLPHTSTLTENVLNIDSPFTGEFETRIVGKFKGNNNCLFKDVNIHFESPSGKELSVLCIGDDTVDMNMPSYIKEYLSQLGYTSTMLGTVKNVYDANGYGMNNLEEEFGEGHRGWRLTDFMCKTKRKDGTSYFIDNNPFMNENKFDFTHYMTSNSYNNVDVVVISAGLNDIIGYHIAGSIEPIEQLTIYQNIEQLPNIYKEMITNIHTYDSNIKIIINPTMIRGTDDDFNRKSLLLTETLVYDLKDMENVFFAPGYITQPIFASANKTATENYDPYNEINDTKVGSSIFSNNFNGVVQSNLAHMIVSTIVGVTK